MELKGKSVIFVGDSLCEAVCEHNDPLYSQTPGWAGRIIAEKEMTGLNRSKGGASMSLCRGENTVINQLIAEKGNKYDYCIIEGGGNDAWDSAPVGAMTEGFEGPFDMNSFAGGLEATFKYAKENYSGARFGFIVTFQMPIAQFGRMSDMSEYFALSKQICDKWEIPCLDLYFDENLNKYLLKTHTTECLPDTVHPNSKGYNILTPYIANWMETL
ncbi:MAG: SGNH/GDSL hydrolase family protein [Clostridia bacterium]|nr:SGNH/GDSL hydrolase family protein [Clostridia bacterium]